MDLKAGQRLKGLRELTGLTRKEFAEVTGIDAIRLKNIEQLNAKMGEEEFQQVGKLFPEMLYWLTFEGDIDLDELKASSEHLCVIIAGKIGAGLYPAELNLQEKIK